ncbi:uncharacterized protein LOC126983134 [Eriocheir sinensis]|uniref:uncharacterized protein LOC126983134 n=1 Tax=Eriocheir sinensis TaxID=95602 RepID=UPI0021C7D8F5|nr:uncharacterized protein LOC126983134 [Eriocheir sinensis]
MKLLSVVVLLGVAASAVLADDDRYFLFHRPAPVQLFRPAPRPVIRPVRYVVRQFAAPISPFHFFDDDHFDRKKRSAESETLAEDAKSRQKRDSDFFDDDDFHFFPVHRAAPRILYRPVRPAPAPAVHYYRPNALPFYFGRGFYDD